MLLLPINELFNQKVGIEYWPVEASMLETVYKNCCAKGAMNNVSLLGFVHIGTKREEAEE